MRLPPVALIFSASGMDGVQAVTPNESTRAARSQRSYEFDSGTRRAFMDSRLIQSEMAARIRCAKSNHGGT